VLATAVQELKQAIAENTGRNVTDPAFARRVDGLISVFYDDIGEITRVSTRTLFDLFVIKVLYVERRSTDANVIDYIGGLLERYLLTAALFPPHASGTVGLPYISDLLHEPEQVKNVQNLFEAYRRFGDNSLFVTGVFPQSLSAGRRRATTASFVDRAYYVTAGKRFYHLASQHDLAELTEQRPLLEKLASYFEVYTESLNELSDRYITGFDLPLIADKMLDNFNAYRQTGDERSLQNARRYAAILKLDAASFPALMQINRSRPHLLDSPAGS
jgi:hypothetical protein